MGRTLYPDRPSPPGSGQHAPLKVRALPSHAKALHEHLARLDEIDRHLRLGRPVAAGAIEAYCTRGRCAEPIILGGFLGDTMIASAELAILPEDRFGLSSEAAKADMLIAVETEQRGRGFASQLVLAMLQRAAAKRIALMRITYAAENAAMARLTARMGAVHSRVDHRIRAELCTGWIGNHQMTIPIGRTQRFRPITLR